MAAPGDPKTPDVPPAHDDHDDLIGFTSPASLTGTERAAKASKPSPIQDDEIERDLFEDRPVTPQSAPRPTPKAEPDLPQWARETAHPARVAAAATARQTPPPEGAMGLYAVYALILFAVPTLGVSALIGLLAVLSRATPTQDLARSHVQFQKRTLVIAAIGAALGVMLILVSMGVFVLVVLALWVLVRGAVGLLRLASGRPMANPKTLFI